MESNSQSPPLSDPALNASEPSRPSLQRVLGVWSAVSIVIGTVIGSGVFLVPSAMIRFVGSVKLLFIVWVVAGLLSLFGALTYAELAAAMPEAGGEYVYLSAAYGPFWGYIYGWTQFWVAKSGSIATLAAGFYTYLTAFVPVLGVSLVVIPLHIGPGGSLLEIHYGQLVAIALILILAAVNYVGVRSGGNVQVFVTAVKMALIGGVIAFGLLSGKGDFSHFGGSIPAVGGIAGFFAAMVSALWAYDGWNNVSMVSSEIRNPQRNLPRSLILGTGAVIVTYLLINVAYFYVLDPGQVAGKSPSGCRDDVAFARQRCRGSSYYCGADLHFRRAEWVDSFRFASAVRNGAGWTFLPHGCCCPSKVQDAGTFDDSALPLVLDCGFERLVRRSL